jgi:GNAT superfamily N-acetyltransferase
MPGSTTQVHIVRPADAAWEEWLGPVPRDVFHTSGYHEYSEASGDGEAYLVVVGTRDRGMAWPYLLRPVPGASEHLGRPVADVSSVYGYPGPLAWGCTPGDPFIAEAWREVQAVWRTQDAITAFTRFHPLLGNASLVSGLRAADVSGREPTNPIVAGGQTVSIDLSLGYQGVRAVYGRDLRREIDASRRAGLVTTVDTEWAELGTFARLYNETMARLQASEFYLFQESDFRRLRDALHDELHLLVTRVDGTVAAAGLFTDWHGLIEWYLVGTDSAYASLSPSKELVDFAVEWAIERGARVLHLGGGRGGSRDSLLWFKSRFSPRRHTFHTGRWILDHGATAQLSRARSVGLEPGMAPSPSFFPEYRAPIVAAAGPEPPGPSLGMERIAKATRIQASRDPQHIQISRVTPADAAVLADLLMNIDGTYFQPHPMTAAEADRISRLRGKDIYLIGKVGSVGVAYGMLRGLDEGFAVPSLGIGIRHDSEHQGYGRAMMTALQDAARSIGARRVRLRVHPENARAATLYRSVGYRETGMDRNEILMILDL